MSILTRTCPFPHPGTCTCSAVQSNRAVCRGYTQPVAVVVFVATPPLPTMAMNSSCSGCKCKRAPRKWQRQWRRSGFSHPSYYGTNHLLSMSFCCLVYCRCCCDDDDDDSLCWQIGVWVASSFKIRNGYIALMQLPSRFPSVKSVRTMMFNHDHAVIAGSK